MWVGQKFRNVRSTLGGVRPIHWFFLVAALLAAGFGYFLQQHAFPKSTPSPFAQVTVSVYTRVNPSRVLLKAKVEPNASQNDSLDITVRGPKGRLYPWLLVVTCPKPVAGRVEMQLIGVTPPQSIEVLASVHDVGHLSVPLRCVSAPSGQHGATRSVVVTGEDINLSLPVLEQSPLGQSAAADTPLYVVRGTSASQSIEKLVEVFQAPESTCPNPGASPASSPSPPSSAVSTPGTTSGGSTPPVSPSVGTSAWTPIAATCYAQLPAGTIATKYSIPTSVTTSEALENVSLSGDRIDSMFPPGQITSDDRIIWQGISGLSPNLSATSLTSAEKNSRDGFFAGLCYGVAAGFIVPFLQSLPEAHDKVREALDRAQKGAAQRPLDG